MQVRALRAQRSAYDRWARAFPLLGSEASGKLLVVKLLAAEEKATAL